MKFWFDRKNAVQVSIFYLASKVLRKMLKDELQLDERGAIPNNIQIRLFGQK